MGNIYGFTSATDGQTVTVPIGVFSFVIVNLGIGGLGLAFEDITVYTPNVTTVNNTNGSQTFTIPSVIRSFSPAITKEGLQNSVPITITPGASSKIFISWTI